MEQVYWLSPPTERGTDTRLLLYRYGNFAYAGSVLTEPVRGLEYLPGVLTGIQAVQGQVPYLCECSALPPDSPYTASLLALQRALDLVHGELDAHTERLAALAAQPGNEWIDAEGGALYFEIETVPGYTCNNSEVIFAKSYRGELMLTLIWYAPHGCLYVTLSPSSGEEQTLVDTLFPQIYGKRRGVTLHEYKSAPARYDERLDRAYIKACRRTVGARPGGGGGGAGDGKEPEEEEEEEEEEGEGPLPPAAHRADPSRIFQRISVWEGSGEVPDPDVIKARDLEEGAAAGEGKAGEEEEGEGKEAEGGAGGGGGGGTVDVSGGEGYTQVYLVMSPSPTATRTPVPLGEDGALGGGGGAGAPTTFLVPREVLFRFGNWVYGGEVDFPVEQLRLGDVPYVLPALQKQQGRLDYIADAKALPAGYTLTPTLQQFMAATAILKAEMEDSQTELAQLGSQPANSWIDEEGAASFFELSFRAASIAGAPASAAAPGSGLAGAEVIAAKIYLFGSSGVVLHVVWFRGSLYCVLADNTDDLPLLDVAFPDVTARNRVVQVREYKQSTAEKLADGSPGAPLPKALRVWEGRRKGAFAPAAAAGSAGAGAAGAGAASAAAAAVADTKPAAAAPAAAAVAPAAAAAAAAAAAVPAAESKEQDAAPSAVAPVGPVLTTSLDIEGDLYDMGGVTAGAKPAAARPAAAGGASAAAASAAAAAAAVPAAAKQPAASQIIQGVAKAPHFVAPLSAGAGGSTGSAGASSEGPSIMGMASKLIMVGGKEDESAPWDATGKPRAK